MNRAATFREKNMLLWTVMHFAAIIQEQKKLKPEIHCLAISESPPKYIAPKMYNKFAVNMRLIDSFKQIQQ